MALPRFCSKPRGFAVNTEDPAITTEQGVDYNRAPTITADPPVRLVRILSYPLRLRVWICLSTAALNAPKITRNYGYDLFPIFPLC